MTHEQIANLEANAETIVRGAAGSSAPACSVFHQTIRQMVDSGWRFEWDLRTGFIGACHPMGGKQTICEIHGNSYIDKDRLGLGITKMLMALGTPNPNG